MQSYQRCKNHSFVSTLWTNKQINTNFMHKFYANSIPTKECIWLTIIYVYFFEFFLLLLCVWFALILALKQTSLNWLHKHFSKSQQFPNFRFPTFPTFLAFLAFLTFLTFLTLFCSRRLFRNNFLFKKFQFALSLHWLTKTESVCDWHNVKRQQKLVYFVDILKCNFQGGVLTTLWARNFSMRYIVGLDYIKC